MALLDTIPSVNRTVAETIIAEIGADMEQFPTHHHLASWAGMCPGNDESAGKRRPGKTRKEYWGAVVDAYLPVMNDEDFVVNQLERLDVDPASIRYVVQSHLHLDHSGAIGHFPNVEYLVQRRELQYAYTPDWFQKPAYIRPDFDKDVRWIFPDGPHDDGYDLFGDGTIKTVRIGYGVRGGSVCRSDPILWRPSVP